MSNWIWRWSVVCIVRLRPICLSLSSYIWKAEKINLLFFNNRWNWWNETMKIFGWSRENKNSRNTRKLSIKIIVVDFGICCTYGNRCWVYRPHDESTLISINCGGFGPIFCLWIDENRKDSAWKVCWWVVCSPKKPNRRTSPYVFWTVMSTKRWSNVI